MPGSIPVYGSNGVVGTHNQALVSGPGIVVAARGPSGPFRMFRPISGLSTPLSWIHRKRGDQVRYLEALLDFFQLGRLNAATGVPGLSRRDALALDAFIPPPEEQAAIARILDAADAAIERARTAVYMADRVRSSLLQAAFTFDKMPARQLKDTNAGRVPNSWDTVKGRAAFEIITGGNSSVGALRLSTKQRADAWFMKVDDFNLPQNRRLITCSQIGFSTIDNPTFKTLPVGTVVIAKRGAAILKNRVRVTDVPVALDPNLMAIGPKNGLGGRFLRYQLEWRNLSRYVESSGVPQLNNKDLYPRWFLKAPLDEQNRVVSALEAAESAMDAQENRLAALERLSAGSCRIC